MKPTPSPNPFPYPLLLLLCLLILCRLTVYSKGIEDKALDNTPQTSETLAGYDTAEAVIDRLSMLPLHSIEGLWRFTAEGTLMAIERTEDREIPSTDAGAVSYRMVIVRAADMSLRPGTIMGYISPTSKKGMYDARIYTGRTDSGTTLHSPRKYTVTLGDEDSRIAINRYGTSYRFNWWRLMPYMYSRLITRRDNNPKDLEGCVRVFPAPAIPIEPRYL